jgi:phosphohistidine phosphatase
LRLLIVRHARAWPAGTRSFSDDERPLTKDGAADFAKVARVLARIAPRPDVILTSPLLRARQTAEIARKSWKSRVRIGEERALTQMGTSGIVRLLAGHRRASLVMVVGHEPGVSTLLAHLVGAKSPSALGFKKGAAALVATSDPRLRGSGELIWFLPPKLLSGRGGRN